MRLREWKVLLTPQSCQIPYLWTTKNPSPNPLGLGHMVFEVRSLVCPYWPCGSAPQPCLILGHASWTATCQASLSFTISQSLLKLMSIESVMPSNHLILCRPLLLLPSIFPSIRVFSNELALHIRWPKYWSFSFNISPSYEYSGLISCRNSYFDLLAVQGTLKSLLQHLSSKASILQCWQSNKVVLSDLTQNSIS